MSSTETKKRGRPRKTEEERKNTRLELLLSFEEYRALKAIAISTNRTMAQVVRDWIRSV